MEGNTITKSDIMSVALLVLLVVQTYRVSKVKSEFDAYRIECEKIDRDAAQYIKELLEKVYFGIDLADDFNHQRDSIYIELEQLRRQQRNNKSK